VKVRPYLILLVLSVIASSPAIPAPLAAVAPHEHPLTASVEDCRRGCAGEFADCNANHPDQTDQCKHDYVQCLAKCTSNNG